VEFQTRRSQKLYDTTACSEVVRIRHQRERRHQARLARRQNEDVQRLDS
jgi:hypothetical protein